jgi:hypothetical protein
MRFDERNLAGRALPPSLQRRVKVLRLYGNVPAGMLPSEIRSTVLHQRLQLSAILCKADGMLRRMRHELLTNIRSLRKCLRPDRLRRALLFNLCPANVRISL